MIHSAALRIFEDELRVLVSEIRRYPALETGGALYGLWSHGGQPTVWLATRAGPEAERRYTSFLDDPHTHMAMERALWERFGMQCVGVWHSHHRLGMQVLSAGDVARTRTYAMHTGRERFAEILGYYRDDGQVGLKPYLYPKAAEGRCVATRIEVLAGASPLRRALGRRPAEQLGDALAPASPRLRNGWVIEPSAPGWDQPAEDDGARRDPQRTDRLIAGVEALIALHVPEPWLPHLALFTPDDGRAILEIGEEPPAPRLRALFTWEGRLELLRWEVVAGRAPARVVAEAEPAAALRGDVASLIAGGLRRLDALKGTEAR